MKRFLIIFLAAATGFIYSGCTKSDSASQGQGGSIPASYIAVKDSSFSPASLSVSIGSTIVFTNQSTLTHTIAGDDTTQLPSKVLAPGTSFSFKPNAPGTVSYSCKTHPSARGTITFTP